MRIMPTQCDNDQLLNLDSVLHKIEVKCLKRSDLVEFIRFVKMGLCELCEFSKTTQQSAWIKK